MHKMEYAIYKGVESVKAKKVFYGGVSVCEIEGIANFHIYERIADSEQMEG